MRGGNKPGFCSRSDWETVVEGLRTERRDPIHFCKDLCVCHHGSWEDGRRGAERPPS